MKQQVRGKKKKVKHNPAITGIPSSIGTPYHKAAVARSKEAKKEEKKKKNTHPQAVAHQPVSMPREWFPPDHLDHQAAGA